MHPTVFNLISNSINLSYLKSILSCFEKVAFLLDITEVITNKRTCIFGDINHDKKNPKTLLYQLRNYAQKYMFSFVSFSKIENRASTTFFLRYVLLYSKPKKMTPELSL